MLHFLDGKNTGRIMFCLDTVTISFFCPWVADQTCNLQLLMVLSDGNAIPPFHIWMKFPWTNGAVSRFGNPIPGVIIMSRLASKLFKIAILGHKPTCGFVFAMIDDRSVPNDRV